MGIRRGSKNWKRSVNKFFFYLLPEATVVQSKRREKTLIFYIIMYVCMEMKMTKTNTSNSTNWNNLMPATRTGIEINRVVTPIALKKLWIKTVKILFQSITQEPLGLLKF